MDFDRGLSEWFLSSLFGYAADDGLRFLVCSKLDFSGRWFLSVPEANEFAAGLSPRTDVYVGVGLRRDEPPRGQRGSAETIDGIVGLWSDIDYLSGTAHVKKKLPPTIDAAREIAATAIGGLAPSVLVASGHGLQAWWLFTEPLIFTKDEDRIAGQRLSVRFAETVRSCAKSRGYTVDSVFDLARVFRLPGTFNRKAEPIPVRVLSPLAGFPRYNVDDIEPRLVAPEFSPVDAAGARRVGEVAFLELHENRNPPENALLALLENNEKARASWNHQRSDLPDKSASSYDFSLAVFAARSGWGDQEIADLLIAHRRKHGESMKTGKGGALRLDYYQRTISAARLAVEQDAAANPYSAPADAPSAATVAAIAAPSAAVPAAAPGEAAPVDDDVRGKVLAKVRRVFNGLPIARFVQRGSGADALFEFILTDGTTIPLGKSRDIDSETKLRAVTYPYTHRFPKRLTRPQFDAMFADLGSIVELIANVEASREGKFVAMLTEYIVTRAASVRAEDWQNCVQVGDPYVRDGALFINTTNIESWAKFNFARKVLSDDLWTDLPAFGFRDDVVQCRVGGRKVSRRYWSIPLDDLDKHGFVFPITLGPGGRDAAGDAENRAGFERVPGTGSGGDRDGGSYGPSAAFPYAGTDGSGAEPGAPGSVTADGSGGFGEVDDPDESGGLPV